MHWRPANLLSSSTRERNETQFSPLPSRLDEWELLSASPVSLYNCSMKLLLGAPLIDSHLLDPREEAVKQSHLYNRIFDPLGIA